MRLKNKLVIVVLSVALLPFIGGMFFLYYTIRDDLRQTGTAVAVKYADTVVQGISSYFNSWMMTSEVMSRFPAVQNKQWLSVDVICDRIAREHDDVTSFVMANLDGTYWYSNASGNPAQGYIITQNDADPAAAPKNISNLSYYKALISDNRTGTDMRYVSEPFMSLVDDTKMFAIASTVFDADNKLTGLIGCTITASSLNNEYARLLADFEANFGRDAVLIVTSGADQLVTRYEFNREYGRFIDSAITSADLVSRSALPAAVQDAIRTAESGGNAQTSFDWDGKPYFMTRTPLENADYAVYLLVPESVLFTTAAHVRNVAVWIGFAIAAVVIIATFIIGSGISRSLVRTAAALRDISEGSGDLTVRLETKNGDEVGDMSRFFNKFIETLHSMIAKIQQESAAMGSVSSDLAVRTSAIQNDIQQISENVTDLNFKTEEQSASATETASTIEQITKNIESLKNQIENQSSAVTQSSAAIQQMVSNINAISSSLDKAAGGFKELKHATDNGKQSINTVQDMVTNVSGQSANLLETNEIINSIASQTNLLAMNAAIEAAHAGDAGKGFSVVADEIRKLAEDSASQSKVIAEELQSIVSNIESIVGATTQAETAFDTIVSQIAASSDLIEQISFAMKEQNEGSKQVLEALENIRDITVEIRDGSVEMNEGTSVILREMTRLTDLSQQVQENAHHIAQAIEEISGSIEEIGHDSEQNNGSVTELTKLTSKFKL
ncbi:MAG TPA: HAMP domain-containing protein [Candidatus Treponema faecavium]|nr:HAMP domain-containing protein [Candidatus Treponema faecavium]